jgi:hypothetical protein
MSRLLQWLGTKTVFHSNHRSTNQISVSKAIITISPVNKGAVIHQQQQHNASSNDVLLVGSRQCIGLPNASFKALAGSWAHTLLQSDESFQLQVLDPDVRNSFFCFLQHMGGDAAD